MFHTVYDITTGETTQIPLTAEEIAEREANDLVYKRTIAVSPRQIRQAMSRAGLRDLVEAAIEQSDQDTKDWYNWATTFERLHPKVVELGSALGKTEAELDALFELAASL